MGAVLDKPKTAKITRRAEGNGLRCGVSEMQGWRGSMEDAYAVVVDIPALRGWSWFAVFDGHGGSKISQYCAAHMLPMLLKASELASKKKAPSCQDVMAALTRTFMELDAIMRTIHDLVKDRSGSTAVAALVSPTHIFVANCGDSRCVVTRTTATGPRFVATRDHKPTDDEEQERVIKADGHVINGRINGDLAVSRALGDFSFKQHPGKAAAQQLVSPQPDVSALERHKEHEFIILACDGVWDVFTSSQVAQVCREAIIAGETDLGCVVELVLDEALERGSRDNITMILVALPGAPTPTDDRVKAHNKLKAARATASASSKGIKSASGFRFGSGSRSKGRKK